MSDLSLIVNILKAASFLNLLLFLHQGKYPTLTQRFLSLSQESTRKRNIEYTYMTRELLWHGFSVGIILFLYYFITLIFIFCITDIIQCIIYYFIIIVLICNK